MNALTRPDVAHAVHAIRVVRDEVEILQRRGPGRWKEREWSPQAQDAIERVLGILDDCEADYLTFGVMEAADERPDAP